MRWPGANLEEKHEPRGVSVAEAKNGDSMKSSGQNLTLAAIEKQSFYLRADWPTSHCASLKPPRSLMCRHQPTVHHISSCCTVPPGAQTGRARWTPREASVKSASRSSAGTGSGWPAPAGEELMKIGKRLSVLTAAAALLAGVSVPARRVAKRVSGSLPRPPNCRRSSGAL